MKFIIEIEDVHIEENYGGYKGISKKDMAEAAIRDLITVLIAENEYPCTITLLEE